MTQVISDHDIVFRGHDGWHSGLRCGRTLGNGFCSGKVLDSKAQVEQQSESEPHTEDLMIAAIYARKSTEQAGVADDQKSVNRQVEHAKAYAARKGWTVDERFIFVDDGISGAEFANRPSFLRLMNSLKPKASFQA